MTPLRIHHWPFAKTWFFTAFLLTFCSPLSALAHGPVPGEMTDLEPGRVISVMHSDFPVRSAFSSLPGPVFYLTHARTLHLSRSQKRAILGIARKIMPQTVKEGREIEREKARLRIATDGRIPLDRAGVRRGLLEISRREALAEYRHIEAHRACLELLSPDQLRRLFRLLPKVAAIPKTPPDRKHPLH
ncbi:MAG: hypothetical protein ACP5OS_09120 [Leptospirillia bacterium]